MVDGTHLHGKYRGHLLIATAQDGNQQIYPITYDVVDSENDNSWTWFFQQLHNVIPSSTKLVFVSDRHLSIDKAVEFVYTTAKHVICTRHLKQNLKTRFKERGVHKLFTKAADSYTMREVEENFQKICTINADMGRYLREANFEKWSRSHCKGDRYNIMTTNNSETLNSVLTEARSYQIVALLEYIRDMLSKWFNERRGKTERGMNKLPPNVAKIMEDIYTLSKRYEIKMLNSVQFQVLGGNFYGVVDLQTKKCSCKGFDLDHMPCAHAIAAILKQKYNITDFVSKYYQYQSWYTAYKETIYPAPKESDYIIPQDILDIE